jgi:hypothetical protein
MARCTEMPVIVEPMDGRPGRVVYVCDHTDTALLLACGGRFPRLGEIRPTFETEPFEAEYDEAEWP